jgi:hypothetical protein
MAMGLLAVSGFGQEPEARKPLTAREMFFAGANAKPAVPAAPVAQQAASNPAAKGVRPKVESATAQKSAPPPRTAQATAATASATKEMAQAPARVSPASTNPNFRAVAYTPETAPLGVRYSILQRKAGGAFEEVAPDSVFRSGDRIRLNVEVNDAGYLYIVHRGSSGTWKLMFPSADTAGGTNRVDKGRNYLLPPGSNFTFVGEPGEEKLFLVLSRQPEPDLETLIDSLQGAKATPAAAPAAPPRQQQMQLASVRLPSDDMIARYRNLHSRDLITEKINEEPTAERAADKAVYVVNSTGQADSRVVADIQLKHQ